MYLNYFPKFKVVEINRSYALTAGHIIAQSAAKVAEIAHKTLSVYDDNGADVNVDVLENGVIVGLNASNNVINYDASKCSRPCLVMNDEIVTHTLEGLNQFCEEFVNGVVYPRVLPLELGDSFTTNNYAGSETGATNAKVVNGVLTLQDAADVDTLFSVKASTLPAGQKAFEFTFVGTVAVAAAAEVEATN